MQRRAARFLKNEYSITPGTVTKILTDMKWPTLEKRRKVAPLTMMLKVVSGHQLYDFHPVYDLKDVRALGNSTLRNSFKLMPKQTNIATQFYCTYNQRLEIFAKLSH